MVWRTDLPKTYLIWKITFLGINKPIEVEWRRYVIIGSDDRVSPLLCQAIICVSAGLLSIGALGINSLKFSSKVKHFYPQNIFENVACNMKANSFRLQYVDVATWGRCKYFITVYNVSGLRNFRNAQKNISCLGLCGNVRVSMSAWYSSSSQLNYSQWGTDGYYHCCINYLKMSAWLMWKPSQNTTTNCTSIQWNAFKDLVCEMATISSQPQCVN